MWKKFIKSYLTFSKNDRIAIWILTGLFVLILLVPALVRNTHQKTITDPENVIAQIKQLNQEAANPQRSQDEENHRSPTSAISEQEAELFYFDPNTIGRQEWHRLGVSKKTAQVIQNYLARGGRFRKPEDLSRIYTLDQKLANRLIPFVRIPEPAPAARTSFREEKYSPPYNEGPVESATQFAKKTYRIIDINTADSIDLISLPQIGSWRSSRILRYRRLLGGFISVDQVAEIREIPDSVFQNIKPYLKADEHKIQKINLRTATFRDLVSHPYIDKNFANAILQYRQQHGFQSVDELLQIHIADSRQFEKIKPYLVLD